jgi:glycosyltransferase involved in cell wall biosynthesis
LKKILIVSALFPPEPVVSASLSYDIASKLSESNEVTVIAPIPSRPNGMKFEENENWNYPFVLRRVKSYISQRSTVYSRFRESHSFGIQTSKFIRKNHRNIDLIYINTWPLLAQLYILYTAKKYSIPVITHIQDIYPESLTQKLPTFGNVLNKILLPIDKFIAINSSSLITISKGMRDVLVKTRNIPINKVSVVFNWQDENKFNINANYCNKNDDYFTFMFVGSLNILADIESVIIAFKNANLYGCRLVIAGEGPEKQNLISYVESNNIDNVIFLSFNSKDVGLVQSNSDVLVLSLKQGASALAFPSKIPAYMFSSRPILAFVDIPSDIAKTVINANCGWVVPSGNIDKLKSSFINISTIKKSDLKNMGESGKKYAQKNLSRSANLNKIVSVIERHLV